MLKALILLITLSLCPFSSPTDHYSGEQCSIAVKTICDDERGCVDFAVFSLDGELKIQLTEDIYSVSAYSVSPDNQRLALDEANSLVSQADPSARRVRIIDISGNTIQEIAVVTGMTSLAWSHDSSRLLLRDYANEGLHSYDLDSGSLSVTYGFPHISLRVYEAEWSPDDQTIAFVADEWPFTTRYGRHQLLFVTSIDGHEVQLVSDPRASVQWYIDQFVWLVEDTLAFTMCTEDDCQLNVITLNDSGRQFIMQGNFSIRGKLPRDNSVLLLESLEGQETTSMLLLNPETHQITEVNSSISGLSPFLTSLSPNGQFISIQSLVGGDSPFSVTDLDDFVTFNPDLPGSPEDAGVWHPDSTKLLLTIRSALYVYDLHDDALNEISVPDLGGNPTLPQWVCPN